MRTSQSTGVAPYGAWPIMPKLNSIPPEHHGPLMAMSRNLTTWLRYTKSTPVFLSVAPQTFPPILGIMTTLTFSFSRVTVFQALGSDFGELPS